MFQVHLMIAVNDVRDYVVPSLDYLKMIIPFGTLLSV